MTKTISRDGSPKAQDAPEDADVAARRLRRARLFVKLSAVLLFVSMLAVIACTRLEWSRIVPYLMWNHVAIIAVAAGGSFALRRLGKRPSGRASPRPGDLFARPIVILAVVAAAVAVPNWGPSPWDMGKAPDGSVVTHHSWHPSSDGSRYFESYNRGPDREITEARYDELDRGVYSMFARMWVLFSFVALMMWRFVVLSRQHSAADPGGGTRIATAVAGGVAKPRWTSTALIAALWTLAIGANLMGFVQEPRHDLCSTPTPPAMRVIVLVLPLVFFGVAAMFMKRSPFISPWIASLVDEKLGAGSSEEFMVRLKPLLLLSAAGIVGSAAMVEDCWRSGGDDVDLTMPGFLLSGSIAFALVHLILRLRRVPGV